MIMIPTWAPRDRLGREKHVWTLGFARSNGREIACRREQSLGQHEKRMIQCRPGLIVFLQIDNFFMKNVI